MNILSAKQFSLKQMDDIFDRADELRATLSKLSTRTYVAEKYKGRQMCALFYQPSTRTRLSFETAAVKFGMGVVSTENAREFSSAAKGETLEDTIRVLNGYHYDIIVIRHHQTGAIKKAAYLSQAPIINAGDGQGEHPTQALLDAYTIKRAHGRLDNLKVVMGGDLRYGRTVRSLLHILARHKGNRFSFVSIPELQIRSDVVTWLKKKKIKFNETTNLAEAFQNADVVYWTRLQTEHLKGKLDNGFTITSKTLKLLPKHAIIMHPLPRVGEIDESVDKDPRAVYFRQAGNGLYVRMALIEQILDSA